MSASEEEYPVEIKNYTPFWALERKVYSFYDIQLPVPVSLTVLGVFVGIGIPWGFLMFLLQVPFTTPWYLLWLIPPAGLAYMANKPIFENKTLVEYLISRGKHLMENRRYKRLEPDLTKYDTTITVEQNVSTKELIKPSPFK